MELEKYEPTWNLVKPLMVAKLEEIRTLFADAGNFHFEDPFQFGDEGGFGMRMNLIDCDGDQLLDVSFVLADGDVHGGDGLSVWCDAFGFNCLHLLGNGKIYGGDAFTFDVDEIVRRVEDINPKYFAQELISDAITDETLLKKFAVLKATEPTPVRT